MRLASRVCEDRLAADPAPTNRRLGYAINGDGDPFPGGAAVLPAFGGGTAMGVEALKMSNEIISGAGLEFRRAWRGLRRAPGFSLGVIVILGLAVGGVVTVGTAAYDLFIKPLPFRDPGRLVQIGGVSERFGDDMGLSPGMVDEVRKSGEYANVAAYSKVVDVIRDKEGQSWKRARIETNLLHLLGVSSIHGRGFLHEDGVLGSAPVALLSERLHHAG
jgi:hypothetical protein